MISAVRHPFGILESPVVRPWGRGGVGGAALALQLGPGRPRGPRSFSPLLGLLPLSLPHLGCLALALPLFRRPVEVLIDLPLPEEEVAPDVLEGFGESGALVHHLVNLAPCTPNSKVVSLGGGFLPAMSSPLNQAYQSSNSSLVTLRLPNCASGASS